MVTKLLTAKLAICPYIKLRDFETIQTARFDPICSAVAFLHKQIHCLLPIAGCCSPNTIGYRHPGNHSIYPWPNPAPSLTTFSHPGNIHVVRPWLIQILAFLLYSKLQALPRHRGVNVMMYMVDVICNLQKSYSIIKIPV